MYEKRVLCIALKGHCSLSWHWHSPKWKIETSPISNIFYALLILATSTDARFAGFKQRPLLRMLNRNRMTCMCGVILHSVEHATGNNTIACAVETTFHIEGK